MDTLIYFLPENKNSTGEIFKDFIVGEKCLRIIYPRRKHGFIGNLIYKIKVRRLTKGHFIIPENDAEGGEELTLFHLSALINKLSDKKPLFFYIASFSHIDSIHDIIMNRKKIFFVTDESFFAEAEEYLLTHFGVSGAVFTKPPVMEGISVIFPGGNFLISRQNGVTINLSGTKLPFECITPADVRFHPPLLLQNISPSLRNARILEYIMLFLGIPFEKATLSSVKINKVIKNKNE